MSRIFLSHSSANNAEAVALRDWLEDQGWQNEVFLDLDPERGVVAGERWENSLNEAANRCEAVLFLLSTDWLKSEWCRKELNLARRLNKRLFGVLIEDLDIADVPLDLSGEWQLVHLTSGRDHVQLHAVLPITHEEVRVTFSGEGLQRLKHGLEQAGLDARYFAWPPKDDPGRPPYRGLEPLEQADAGIFFGRDGSIVEVLDQLRGLRDAAPPRLFVILGASGAGKSSFMRAGLIPRLARDDRNFYTLPIIRPETAVLNHPASGFIASLEEAFRSAEMARTRAEIRSAVEGGARMLGPLLIELASKVAAPALEAETTPAKPPTLILPLDQGEELFLSKGADETQQFLCLLRDLLSVDAPAIAVLITIRSDNYEPLQTARALDGIRKIPFDLGRMPTGAYSQIITGPADRLKGTHRPLEIEPELVQALLKDIEKDDAKDALPLLAFTLQRLYVEHGGDGNLKLSEYVGLGRIKGSIEAAVASAMQAADKNPDIPRDEKDRLVLLRRGLIPWLASVDPDTRAPRRRVAKYSEIPEEARPLIDLLVEQHLLSADKDKATGVRTIEPAHEALLRQWGRLEGWLKDASADLATLEGIVRAASRWKDESRRRAWLVHRGTRLTAAMAVFERNEDLRQMLGADGKKYLDACVSRELGNVRVEKRKRRQLKAVAALMTVFGLGAFWLWNVASIERDRASNVQWLTMADQANQHGNQGDGTKRLLLAMEARAQRIASPLEKNVRLARETIARQLKRLKPISSLFGKLPDQILDTGKLREKAILLSEQTIFGALNTRREIAVISDHKSTIRRIAFSPDGNLFVTGDDKGVVKIWDARTLKLVNSLNGHKDRIRSIKFSPDGKLIATASEDSTVRIWERATGRLKTTFEGHRRPVYIARFDTNSFRVVSASADSTLRVWDYRTGAQEIAFKLHVKKVTDATFTPDGRHLISTSGDNKIGIWDVARKKHIRWLRGHSASVYSLALNHDATRLATAGANGWPHIWDVAGPDPSKWTHMFRGGMRGHEAEVFELRFSPDGERMLSVSEDETARLWSVRSGEVIGVLKEHSAAVNSGSFSNDGRRIVTASKDGTARIWDGLTGLPLITLRGHRDQIFAAEFSPNSRILVTGSADDTVRVWNVEPGREILRLPNNSRSKKKHTSGIVSSAIAPDGRHVATASLDNKAIIWDLENGDAAHVLRHNEAIWNISYGPRGLLLATASDDETAAIWDARAGKRIHTLKGHESWVSTSIFSPDGRYLVTTSGDKTARIWDVVTGKQKTKLLGHLKAVRWAEFNAKSNLVVTTSWDRTTRVWNAVTGRELWKRDTEHDQNIAKFSPDGKTVTSIGTGGIAYLWEVATGKLLHRMQGHAQGINFVTFNRTGTLLATASNDKTARIWDLRTGRTLQVLRGHDGRVQSIDFSKYSGLVLTTSQDHTARIWDVCAGIEILVLLGHSDKVEEGRFMPDQNSLLTISRDKTARRWSFDKDRVIYSPECIRRPPRKMSRQSNVFLGSNSSGASSQQLRMHIRSSKELLALARKLVPRCLKKEERKEARLAPAPPAWCIEKRKWPYHNQRSKQ